MTTDPADDALLARRIVAVRGTIDDNAATIIIAKLLFLQSEGSAPVTLDIESPGGAPMAALAICDTMDSLEPAVHTHCRSRADGVAAALLAHGEPGHRSASAHAHIGLAPIPETTTEDARGRVFVVDQLATDTHRPLEDLVADLQVSRSFDATDAKTYGFIDRVR